MGLASVNWSGASRAEQFRFFELLVPRSSETVSVFEGIDDSNSIVVLTIVHIFRADDGTVEFGSGGENGGVPLRIVVAPTQDRGGDDDFVSNGLDSHQSGQSESSIDVRLGCAESWLLERVRDVYLKYLRGKGEGLIPRIRFRATSRFLTSAGAEEEA